MGQDRQGSRPLSSSDEAKADFLGGGVRMRCMCMEGLRLVYVFPAFQLL